VPSFFFFLFWLFSFLHPFVPVLLSRWGALLLIFACCYWQNKTNKQARQAATRSLEREGKQTKPCPFSFTHSLYNCSPSSFSCSPHHSPRLRNFSQSAPTPHSQSPCLSVRINHQHTPALSSHRPSRRGGRHGRAQRRAAARAAEDVLEGLDLRVGLEDVRGQRRALVHRLHLLPRPHKRALPQRVLPVVQVGQDAMMRGGRITMHQSIISLQST
jgi:hypothetical protein